MVNRWVSLWKFTKYWMIPFDYNSPILGAFSFVKFSKFKYFWDYWNSIFNLNKSLFVFVVLWTRFLSKFYSILSFMKSFEKNNFRHFLCLLYPYLLLSRVRLNYIQLSFFFPFFNWNRYNLTLTNPTSGQILAVGMITFD